MKAGRNFVTSGPLLLMQIGGHQVGDVIHLSDPSDFQVNLQAWPSGAAGELLTRVELIRNGEIAKVFRDRKAKKRFFGRIQHPRNRDRLVYRALFWFRTICKLP